MGTLFISRKFYALVLGVATIIKMPPFSTIGPKLQAVICGGIIIAYILGTAIESGLERFGSLRSPLAPPLKKPAA